MSVFNRMSYTVFQLVLTLVTLNDLEQRNSTPTACSANPDHHRQAGFQRRCTINVERSTELRSPK